MCWRPPLMPGSSVPLPAVASACCNQFLRWRGLPPLGWRVWAAAISSRQGWIIVRRSALAV